MIIFKIVSTIVIWALSKRDESTALMAEITIQIIDAIIDWMSKKGYFNVFEEENRHKESSAIEETQSESLNSPENEEITEHNGNSS